MCGVISIDDAVRLCALQIHRIFRPPHFRNKIGVQKAFIAIAPMLNAEAPVAAFDVEPA